MITICVPVLKRYDLLEKMVTSLEASTVRPDKILVLDNGRKQWKPCGLIETEVFTPAHPFGVATSWNWLIRNTTDERVITNDDITFAPESLGFMLAEPTDMVRCNVGFSCFVLRDTCVSKVGYFDETISPGYAYFEDRDYHARMKEVGATDVNIECGVVHAHSQTLAASTPYEVQEHNRKFLIAQENFLKKWGELPEDLVRQMA